MESEIGFTVLKVILDPLIQLLIGGEVVFNKSVNEKIERQPSKISKIMREFLFTLDEEIILWFAKHDEINKDHLLAFRQNGFAGLFLFRGLISVWKDVFTFQNMHGENLNTPDPRHPLNKILSNFLVNNSDMFFEKIIRCPDDEKKTIRQEAAAELKEILLMEKLENRKKEILSSSLAIKLPTDKILSKKDHRNSHPLSSPRDNLSPRNKAHSVSAREVAARMERLQVIHEFMQKLEIAKKFPEFAVYFKNALIDLPGRELKIFERRPYMTCKDQLMNYLAEDDARRTVEIADFISQLNKEISHEADSIEKGQKIRMSSQGSDASPRLDSQESSPYKEKE